jgi:hypothetical protein
MKRFFLILGILIVTAFVAFLWTYILVIAPKHTKAAGKWEFQKLSTTVPGPEIITGTPPDYICLRDTGNTNPCPVPTPGACPAPTKGFSLFCNGKVSSTLKPIPHAF